MLNQGEKSILGNVSQHLVNYQSWYMWGHGDDESLTLVG